MTTLKSLIIVLLFAVTSCNSNDKRGFSLTVNHYGGGAGITIIYSIDEKGLQVDTNCDLANCKQATVYTRTFSDTESDSIFNFINSLKLDTLKREYRPTGLVYDGLYSEIKFKKGLFSSHKSSFDNISTPTTDILFAFIDELVKEKKYRFANWGRDE
jgi:hypothetical protein